MLKPTQQKPERKQHNYNQKLKNLKSAKNMRPATGRVSKRNILEADGINHKWAIEFAEDAQVKYKGWLTR